MLTRTGLRDDAALPHSLGKKALAYGVVDLVGARVIEILPLDRDSKTRRLANSVSFRKW